LRYNGGMVGRRRILEGLAVWALALLGAGVAGAQGLTIAAASDLQAVMPEIVARFERETGRTARVTFGSSGNFFTQIQNGAPFDEYFSADVDYPKRLEAAALAEPGTLYHYATGRLVLWTIDGTGVDPSRGLPVLRDPIVRRIAIANPAHAPYGRAAVDALRRAGVYDAVADKLVLGENISQAAQFVESGNAQVGLLALSIALSPAMAGAGRFAPLDPVLYAPIEQAAVIIRRSRNQAAARAFLAFVRRPEIVELLRRSGFEAPAR
jgi:molybdate transport system substrate-binding protein